MSVIDQVLLLDRQTVDETTSKPVFVSQAKRITFYLWSEGTTSSGVITLEESRMPSYTGTWSSINTQNASAFTGGAELDVHVDIGSAQWVRARISTTIGGGGTVSVALSGL